MNSDKSTRSKIAGLLRTGRLILVVVLLLGGGWLMRGAFSPVGDSGGAMQSEEHADHGGDSGAGGGEHDEHAVSEESGEDIIWSCSMDPQVQQPQPGLCPICGMDLIPVATAKGAGLRELKLSPEEVALIGLRTSPVIREFPIAEVRLVGMLGIDETRRRYVTTRIPGFIERLFVDYVGVTVRPGDHLVEIYSPELLVAQEELLESQRTLDQLESSNVTILLDSTRRSVEEGRRRLERFDMTPAQIDELLLSGVTSDRTTIYATRGGVVTKKLVEEGANVAEGARIYSLDDLTELWLMLDAYESNLPWLHYGQSVEFEAEAFPGVSFVGTIAFIARELDPQTRTIKVRVNVPNPEERLKPGMFVRAIVRSKIAGDGMLMDSALAGKWICPMHPEVLSSEPGDCYICGMDLVTTESLGWVSAVQEGVEPPLVIPVSAVLSTGTRAVVYVRVSDQDVPTFEGREIILGPRAGDVYIVRHGLEDGELVVTRGNFKLDSALQIQARPSMMSPDGGGGGGGHQHGARKPTEEDDEPVATSMVELSPGLRFRLERLVGRGGELERAIASDDIAAARGAMGAVVTDLEGIEKIEIPNDLRPTWNELAMRLSNDAFEGANAISMEGVRVAAPEFERRLMHIAEMLGVESSRDNTPAVDLPLSLTERLSAVWDGYAPLARSLADDEFERAHEEVVAMQQAMTAADELPLKGEFADAWVAQSTGVESALAAMNTATDEAGLRTAFDGLSIAVDEMLTGYGAPGSETIYRVHCPMAFDGRGANWLSPADEVRNPFYGSMMYSCGSVVGSIPAGGGNR